MQRAMLLVHEVEQGNSCWTMHQLRSAISRIECFQIRSLQVIIPDEPEDDYSRMTVVELRAKCVSRKLSQAGLKQQLIQVRCIGGWRRGAADAGVVAYSFGSVPGLLLSCFAVTVVRNTALTAAASLLLLNPCSGCASTTLSWWRRRRSTPILRCGGAPVCLLLYHRAITILMVDTTTLTGSAELVALAALNTAAATLPVSTGRGCGGGRSRGRGALGHEQCGAARAAGAVCQHEEHGGGWVAVGAAAVADTLGAAVLPRVCSGLPCLSLHRRAKR